MPVPATLEHKLELFRSSGKIFRDDNELFSEPSWIAVMVGQGIVPQAYHPFADQPSETELKALMARVRAGIARLAASQPRHADYIDRSCRVAAGYQA